MDSPMATVRYGRERVRVYAAGGIGFDRYAKGIGWVVNDRPSKLIADYALALQAVHAPTA